MPYRLIVFAVVTVLFLWSFRPAPKANPLYPLNEQEAKVAPLATKYDATKNGTIHGEVDWEGKIPVVEPFQLKKTFYTPAGREPKPNPNAVHVTTAKKLPDTVIFLRQVDLARSRAWDLPLVTIEADELDINVRQHRSQGRIGFVQRGSFAALISLEPMKHSVRARGAEFFTQTLSDVKWPVRRDFANAGLVELSNGGEFTWARAYLFVSDHPYYTLTDANGKFELSDVPEGEHELVYWKPNWHIAKRERDPEFIVYNRITYHPPVEQVIPIRVRAGKVTQVKNIAFNEKMFEPK
jgi:hypothetical protein